MTGRAEFGGIPLVLGGNVFGWTADQDTSFAVLDAFYEAGGRMIDTADVYSVWVPGHKGGESEAVIGNWLTSRGVRADMRIHTKTGMMGGAEQYEPATVLDALDRCLERLRTDYVDLFYAHRDFEERSPADIAAAFAATVDSGKARAIGASNFTAERLGAALEAARASGQASFSALQNEYNLVSRDKFGGALQQLCIDNDIAMYPFYGLAAGYLSGKYREAADFEGKARSFRVKEYSDRGPPVLAVMDEVAAESGATLPAIALAWLGRQPAIRAPIASARTVEQLADLLEFTRLKLDEDQLARLTAAL